MWRSTAPGALTGVDAVLVPGGFGERGIDGKLLAIRYAREHNIPYLGICLGMQLAIIEYARNVAGLEGAHSTEFNRAAPHPVIALITEWQDAIKGTVEQRSDRSDMGGTMRLGAQEIRLSHGARAHQIYGSDVIMERHRHRFEFNNRYLQKLMNAGLRFSGFSRDGLVEMIELPRTSVLRREPVPSGVPLDAARWPPAVHRLHQGGAGVIIRSRIRWRRCRLTALPTGYRSTGDSQR